MNDLLPHCYHQTGASNLTCCWCGRSVYVTFVSRRLDGHGPCGPNIMVMQVPVAEPCPSRPYPEST